MGERKEREGSGREGRRGGERNEWEERRGKVKQEWRGGEENGGEEKEKNCSSLSGLEKFSSKHS